jgi:membrane protein YfhO
MQHEIADSPSSTAPGKGGPATRRKTPERQGGDHPAPGAPRPSPRALVLEGLIVYIVLQLLTYPFLPAVRDRGQAFYNDVLIGFFGPEKHGLARILRAGILPTWVNDQYGGEPFIANLQHAVFYPGNLPFWLMRTSTAIDVVGAVHVAFAGLAMWAYCRFALRTSRWGAALAGLAFAFGSVSLDHIILMNQLQVIAWMPLVLLFAHLALERGQLRYVLLTALAIGVQLLAGHPEEWAYTLLALGIYGAGWVLVSKPREWRRRALHALTRLGGALGLFALLFAWQLLPTLLLQRNGYRTDPTFDQQFPLPKSIAFNALLPDFGRVLNGENVAFIGVVALGLAGLGIAAGPRRLRWARSAMIVLAVLGVIMALGNQNAIYRFAYHHLPLVQQFRVPGRYLLLTYFATAAASALGMDVLLYGPVGHRVRRVGTGVGGLVVVGVVLGTALLFGGKSGAFASWPWWVLAGALGLVGWVLANFKAVPRTVIALLLIGVTGVELHQARPNAEYHEVVPNVVYNDPGPIMRRLAADGGRYVTIASDVPVNDQERSLIPIPAGITGRERDYFQVSWPRRLAARPAWEYSTGAETIIGRDGGLMPLRSYDQFFSSAVDPGGDLGAGTTLQPPSQWNWTALDLLGVRSFVAPASLAASETAILRAHGFTTVEREAFFQLWERPVEPVARMVYQTDVVPSAQARLTRLQHNYPLLDRAMVERPVGQFQTPATSPTVGVVRRGYSKVDLSVQTQTQGLLVLPDPHYPQWRVSVDGKPARLLEVDHAFRGVVVPAGAHRVVFTYQDRAMQGGALLSLLTCLGLVGVGVLGWRRRRSGNLGQDGDDGHNGDGGEGNGGEDHGGNGRPAERTGEPAEPGRAPEPGPARDPGPGPRKEPAKEPAREPAKEPPGEPEEQPASSGGG